MIAGAIIGGALVALGLLDAIGKRGRAKAIPVLEPSNADVSDEHVFIVRPGVVLDEPTRRAASAHARANGLLVLDLVPPEISSWRVQFLLTLANPIKYRSERIANGASACDALLVERETLARAIHEHRALGQPASAVAFAKLAQTLKYYASTEMDFAVAPGLASPGIPLRERRRLLRMAFGNYVGPVIGVHNLFIALAIALAPAWGLAALAVRHLEILLSTLGTALAPRDRLLHVLGRTPIDLGSTFGPLADGPEGPTDTEGLRRTYASLLANGTTPFFEPEREDCPICAARGLTKILEMGDRYQGKPGRFALSRCEACGHVFQNPRLSIEGLNFYYRDFYDGQGEEALAGLFASNPAVYRARARMVAEITTPHRWLDVGAGHGHFCSIARDLLPDTHFDGLDLAASIEDAERRRWVEHGIRGLFPEVAPTLVGRGEPYDVISMSHYLEHTTDPRAEIAAAAKVLPEGGFFFIEVPDPDCRLAYLLGRQWMQWFQPQHLHFLSAANLERLLREHGFEPVAWHRGEAHQPIDFTFSMYLLFADLAPLIDGPWRPASQGTFRKTLCAVLRAVSLPFFLVATLLDHAVAPLVRRLGWSNTYRVVARRVPMGWAKGED
ncbi:class I SAM-dependent methyltransferase [Pendulispora albinea]|uniref:Class I SAM-dependent methyltransferase n=1 Tax=Pendulispora albinea TaxID=2741071 RepID=A0ABZ2M8E0_9BACT